MPVMIPFVRRFVAGETAEEALDAVRRLNAQGISATLDYLGEECKSRTQAEASCREILRLLELIGRFPTDIGGHNRSPHASSDRAPTPNGEPANVSIKLTQLGLNLDTSLAKNHLIQILKKAAQLNNFIRIDMEGSAYTQRTLDLFFEIFQTYKNVGVVIQAYLKRSIYDIDRLIEARARVRLCKGAYREPPAIAYQGKAEVNQNYDRLARKLLEHGDYPAIATHDDDRIRNALEAVGGLSKERFEFQMLYGVRRSRWKELIDAGWRLRVYVPYGTHWLPYYYRRIRERKENLIFALRSLVSD